MSTQVNPIVLGSRSPQRRELLAQLIGDDRIVIKPPLDPSEPNLSDAEDLHELKALLSEVARLKQKDVVTQLQGGSSPDFDAVLTADTVIVGTHANGQLAVLGQPPQGDGWQATVRDWFKTHFIGQTHLALTAVCVMSEANQYAEQVVTSAVRFREDAGEMLDWYLATNEPIGKAGGYGLQGIGSLFVDSIVGSPSNVIGLPLWETAALLRQLEIELV